MKKYLGLTKRNLLVYFKDKQSIIFSLLTSIIVLGLYLLFLKETFVYEIEAAMKLGEGLDRLISKADIEMYSNLILLTGILGSAMITVPFQCLMTVVRDREDKVDYDILATPVQRSQIVFAYFTAAALSAIIMTGIILTAGLVILSFQGSLSMDWKDILAAYGTVSLGSISSTALFMIVVLFFHSTSASGAFFGMLSAAAGFVIGAYIPISQFSTGVQTFCNFFPASQVTIILRNVLLNGKLDAFGKALGGIDEGRFTGILKEVFSFQAMMFSHKLNITEMLIYVIAGIGICILIMGFAYSKTYKKR